MMWLIAQTAPATPPAGLLDGIATTQGGLAGLLLAAVTVAWRLAVAYRSELLANAARESRCAAELAAAAATVAARDETIKDLRARLAERAAGGDHGSG